MKKISADYIFPGNSAPIKNGVITIDSNNEILAVLNPAIDAVNWDNVKKYTGIICPGFVNTHCHLELSYLKGAITENKQLHGFVQELMAIRNDASIEERLKSIVKAENEMLNNGIVAVGDIVNGSSTFLQKSRKKLKYHSFIEVFGLENKQATPIFEAAELLKKGYFDQKRVSIAPHAPYSVSNNLLELVDNDKSTLLTIHNQETASENELFKKGSGAMFNQLSQFSAAINEWIPTNASSLRSYLLRYSNQKKMLLVHNTFTTKEDIEFAEIHSNKIYWCFCPNANEYIEGKQPDYNLFLNEKCTIGTDSLASNWSLSILDELKTMTKKEPSIPLEKLIKWATFNGAEFLGFMDLGSIENGKRPGLNLISNVENNKLTAASQVRIII